MRCLKSSQTYFFQSFVALKIFHVVLVGTESRSDAQSLLLALLQLQFNATLKAIQSVLAYTRASSVKLQGCYSDIAQAYRKVENVKSTVCDLRCNVNIFHARKYAEAKQIAKVVHVDESIPRLASSIQHYC